MPEWLEPILRWLQDSALGGAVRSTPFTYATLESLHILGIAVLVGPAFAFDLCLLGFARSLPPPPGLRAISCPCPTSA
ncbi:hypothetical protein StoSoilB20_19550 [Arthrobacter sp. StoSoilB20]|nr:hypothetical protein StoSoilB20_19550 [Arthrobacter sp. StoSoilB20]